MGPPSTSSKSTRRHAPLVPSPTGCYACAHRGLSSEFTENTIASFQAAAQAGFQAIELDVRLTRDGEVIVLHDASLARTTDGAARVADMRYDEVRSYSTQHGPVPRLDDVLSTLRDWRGIWNIEVKARAATEPAIHLLEHHGLADRALVTSFDPSALETARSVNDAIARGLIVMGPVEQEEIDVAGELGCAWFNADHTDLDAKAVAALRDAGLEVGAWTVNDPVRAKDLATLGASCVITDRRAVLHALDDTVPFL